MAILLDKEGLQNYANKMVLAENRKVGSKSLPTALADVDNLIEEMKDQFEAEYGSALDMKLENSSGAFSVGTGNGVDKRADVENSFTDVEIFGSSILNAHNGFIGATGKCTGDTIKPNTVYTLVANIIKVGYQFNFRYYKVDGTTFRDFAFFSAGHTTTGIKKLAITTVADCVAMGCYPTTPVEGNYISDLMILEGDHTNTPLSELPYVEGIQGVGEEVENGYEVRVKSCGKNLINPNEIVIGEFYRGGIIQKPGTKHFCSLIRVKPNTSYTLNGGYNTMYIELGNTPTDYIKSENGGSTFTTTPDTNYLRIRPHKNPEQEGCIFNTLDEYISIIQLEESPTQTPYEPYVEDTLTYTLEEQLHRLPNGVCDEIKDGKLIRRVGKIVLDGSEDWDIIEPLGTHTNFRKRNINEAKKYSRDSAPVICDMFSKGIVGEESMRETIKLYYQNNEIDDYMELRVSILNSKLVTQDINGFRQWLSENPTTVYYELETPVITELPAPSLQCWKNGTISIDSTVPPTTTHTVALNKPAQIKRNIEELTTLRHKVKTLEEQYDQIALEQAHKLQLLNHSIELEGKR